MKQCVFCETTSNLNNEMIITVDDAKVSVDICDEHAEDATIKTVREAYIVKQKKVEEFLAQAKAMGFELAPASGNSLVTMAPQEQKAETPKPTPTLITEVPKTPSGEVMDIADPDVVSTSVIDGNSGMQSVGGSTSMGAVSSHSSHVVSGNEDVLSPELLQGKAKMAMVEAREGMPIAIPEKRVDGTGTTRIRVSNKENDRTLQDRFKKMADDSIHQNKVPNFARNGYSNTTVNCPMCRGVGRLKNAGETIDCPKCDGQGLISTY